MDGLLVIDKPVGPTSHDVVARIRRVLDERRIGHTGTLDPAASGVLPLVVGRATRLARFLSAVDKTYEAVVRLGFSTDTYDAQGQLTQRAYEGPLPSPEDIDHALDAFRGTFDQRPPAYSAKKIGGTRSYRLARRAAHPRSAARPHAGDPEPPTLPQSIAVTVKRVEILEVAADMVRLRVDCSSGFYMRSLAHDLGQALGIGASLWALRRTRSGEISIESATPLAVVEAGGDRTALRLLVPLSGMLLALPPVVLTREGMRRAASGRNLDIRDALTVFAAPGFSLAADVSACGVRFRLLGPEGHLVGIAEPVHEEPGLLHPSVILM